MPLNLVDPASRMDYFTAAQRIISAAQSAGLMPTRRPAYAGLPALAHWENIFQRCRRRLDGHAGDHARLHAKRPGLDHGLYDMDTCAPACSKFGPYAILCRAA